VNGRYVPETGALLERLQRAGAPGEPERVFMQNGEVVAAWIHRPKPGLLAGVLLERQDFGEVAEEGISGARMVSRMWHLIEDLPGAVLRDQWMYTDWQNKVGADIQTGALLVHPDQIYLAPGTTIRPGALLNAEAGPIILAQGAAVLEGAIVRGPCYIGPHSQIKVAARVQGLVMGPHCKVGGEVESTVIHSYSSKAHDGYLGNSYLGQWCNLGADTNTSNLKNDYGLIKLYSEALGRFENTGRQFLGLFMGDHSKCGINTMFNTGTVVGVFCNIFGAGYPPLYIPSFSWGGAGGLRTYHLRKALQVARAVMQRRDKVLTEAERTLLTDLFEVSTAP
jgi:UDP-N-acetylglucosamine diphosphorylase/glucosamine-1-phosphate N-acetyltransferase